jgi:hypothetical protein
LHLTSFASCTGLDNFKLFEFLYIKFWKGLFKSRKMPSILKFILLVCNQILMHFFLELHFCQFPPLIKLLGLEERLCGIRAITST